MRAILMMCLALSSTLTACDAPVPRESEARAGGAQQGSDAPEFTREALATHIRRLASDEFAGRQPGSDGEQRTVAYLTEAFRKIGLKPGNGSSYTQAVPYVKISTVGTPELRIAGKGGAYEPKIPEDFVLGSRTGLEEVSIESAGLVFAGYGVTAPEQAWNDYAGWDAAGKAVIVLVNDPGFGSEVADRFKGNEMTYYGRWTYKYEECARRRAAACLIVHDDAGASYGWNVVQSSFGARAQFDLDRGDAGNDAVPVIGWLTTQAARELFEKAGQSFDALKRAAHEPGFKAVALADLQLDAQVRSKVERGTSKNVLATLLGKTRPDEWVVVTGHWDHLGTAPREDGGVDVYNGAIDNASGLAAMLEIADALKAGGGSERSVLFLAVTLEESGLIGSRYYAANPVVPLEQTVANVNIDGLLPVSARKDVHIIGYGQSELEDIVRHEAEAQGRRVGPNPAVEAGLFFRSDQFAFAQVGVPGLFMGPGDEPARGGDDAVAAERAAITARYHTPQDDFSEDWTFDALLQDVGLHYRVVRVLADGQMWPQWREGSEFRALGEARRR